jgi:antitoxin (DNA-binding transcriptional repressor) of toxin-antitoxin stability system
VKTISMLEFRRRAESVIRELRAGERMVLTYRGQPVARLEPITESRIDAEDPFYALAQLADQGGPSLTNREMDRIVYGA